MRKEERVIKLGLPQSSWEVEESGIGFMIISDVECLEKQVPSWKNIQRNPGSLRRGVFHSSKDPALPPHSRSPCSEAVTIPSAFLVSGIWVRKLLIQHHQYEHMHMAESGVGKCWHLHRCWHLVLCWDLRAHRRSRKACNPEGLWGTIHALVSGFILYTPLPFRPQLWRGAFPHARLWPE